MSKDTELLRQYVGDHVEGAFTELVHRHVNLVYSAALRETNGDTALAEDISQSVFVELARKAAKLLHHPALAGWLYTSVRHVSANIRRSESRRLRREQEAHAMNELTPDDAVNGHWHEVRPVLDDAMHELNEADRAAVVLRFFQGRSLREVGNALGLNENAARMRVDRALDKLRSLLARRGITTTASGLAAALAAGAVIQAPPALAAVVGSAAIVGAATTTSATLSIVNLMSMSKVKTILISTLAVAGITVPVWQETRVRQLVAENSELQARSSQIQELKAQLAGGAKPESVTPEIEQVRKENERMKLEVARLRSMAGVARRAESEAAELRMELARRKAESGTNQIGTPMGDVMNTSLEQQFQGQLSRMQAKLHLTPKQSEDIWNILQRQLRYMSKSMQKAFAGKLSQQDMSDLRQEAFNPEAEILELLTPEQKTRFAEYKQDENASNARLAANMELLQLQGSLNLSSEQQDQVFSVLYDQSLRQMQGQTAIPPSSNPADIMQSSMEQKATALESVLTDEQLQTYRRQQELQLKAIKNILPETETASTQK